MPRIQPVNAENANEATTQVLETVKKKMGGVPNLLSTMANSPAVANSYLAFSSAIGEGTLSGALRERIALAVGQANNCDYCLAAHTALGKMAGLSEEDIVQARGGTAEDPKDAAAVELARKLVENRGHVSDQDVDAVRDAGLTDGEIGEVVAIVALNIFTNYFNHVAETEVDFPAAPELAVS